MSDPLNFVPTLEVFAQYGFRKASMDDLARASDVSRQTLYNRFGSKEAIRDWALDAMIVALLDSARGELGQSATPQEDLLNLMRRWAGDHVGMINGTPHGAALFDMATAALEAAEGDPYGAFEAEIADYLVSRNLAPPDRARDLVFAMLKAGAGLMIKSKTPEAFEAGMTRVIGALFPPA